MRITGDRTRLGPLNEDYTLDKIDEWLSALSEDEFAAMCNKALDYGGKVYVIDDFDKVFADMDALDFARMVLNRRSDVDLENGDLFVVYKSDLEVTTFEWEDETFDDLAYDVAYYAVENDEDFGDKTIRAFLDGRFDDVLL